MREKCQCDRVCKCLMAMLSTAPKKLEYTDQQKLFLAAVGPNMADIVSIFEKHGLMITFNIVPRSHAQ